MRTRAKKKHVASDRTRRENVPRHILSYEKPLYAEIKMCYTGLTSCLGWKCIRCWVIAGRNIKHES